MLVVLLHARSSVVSPIPLLLAAIFSPGLSVLPDIAYYCVGKPIVHTKKTGQAKGRGVKACYKVQQQWRHGSTKTLVSCSHGTDSLGSKIVNSNSSTRALHIHFAHAT